jgi:outer membrane biosynthesis protein TonB
MTSAEDKKNKRIAMLTSVGLHAAILLGFIFMVAWRPPNPPLPQIGLEMNFGIDEEGSGDVQPEKPVGSEGTQPDDPDQPEPEEVEAETPKPVEPEVQDEPVVTKTESPVHIEEKKEEVKQPEKPVVKPEVKKEEPIKPKPDPNATYKPTTPKNESTNTTTDGKTGTAGSHGDDKNKTGDEGDPKGSLDAKSLYGRQGGGGGPKLDLAGWDWDWIPEPKNLPPGESGMVVFKITVNSQGEIERITKENGTVSPEAENILRREIQRLTFTKKGANVPDYSEGTIKFIIRAQ